MIYSVLVKYPIKDTEKQNLEEAKQELSEIQEKLAAIEEGKKLFRNFLKSLKNKKCCPLCDTRDESRLARAKKYCEENVEFKNKGKMVSEKEELVEKIQKLEEAVKIISEIEALEKEIEGIDKEFQMTKNEAKKLQVEKSKLEKEEKNLKEKLDSIDLHAFQSFKEMIK